MATAHDLRTPTSTPPSQRFLVEFRARWLTFAAIVLAAAVVAAGVSMLLPTSYRAESTLLPPTDRGEAGFGMLEGMIQSSALSSFGLGSSATPSDVFAEILKSRRLGETAITKFGLMSIYHLKDMDRAYRTFSRHLAVHVNVSGILTVSFEDHDPRRAAAVANYLVSELDRFNVETFNTKGKRLRQFLQVRLTDVQQQLAVSEQKLQEYEREHRIVSSSENDPVHGASDMLAQKFNLQTQRDYVSSYTAPGNTERSNIERQLSALNSEIAKLPEMKREGARLALDVEVQRKLLVLMSTQFEDARMQETRDTPTVTVLDVASVPLIRARPMRSVIVVVTAFVAFLGCAAWTLATLPPD